MLSLQLVSSIFRFLPELPVEVLALKEREFILAARTSGKGEVRIAMDHILPNIASVLIVQGTIQFALGILAEAGLSYLGLGTQPPMPSWGKMLSEAQTMMFLAPNLQYSWTGNCPHCSWLESAGRRFT